MEDGRAFVPISWAIWATGRRYIHIRRLESMNLSRAFSNMMIRGPSGMAAANSCNR